MLIYSMKNLHVHLNDKFDICNTITSDVCHTITSDVSHTITSNVCNTITSDGDA